MPGLDIYQEASRELVICNACRYCEGYCAFFRAIEIRRDFEKGDVSYLSHLCHDCRACYYACMYTPPHEFAMNIPEIMSKVRMESYQRWSWPAWPARSFANQGIGVALGAIGATIVVAVALLLVPSGRMFTPHVGPGAFYEVIPHLAMVIPAMILSFYGLAVWIRGGTQFWSEARGAMRQPGGITVFLAGLSDVLGLRYLKGGGPGCPYPDERPSFGRWVCHSLTFWGFISAFIATLFAFVYEDLLHWMSPYPVMSAPVLFGSIGGVAMIIGTAGLMWFKGESDPAVTVPGMRTMDYVFLSFLGITALTGMLTLLFRTTSAMGIMLTVHLAVVAALYITAPYGKFVHLVYRTLALVQYRIEQRQAHQHVGH
jgi:citrate/tricarballylate utilization protein